MDKPKSDPKPKPLVVLGLLGTTLDAGFDADRWNRWRPTVSLCRHEDLLVHRLELLAQPGYMALAGQIKQDLAGVSPETEVRLHEVALDSPWDFERVFETLHAFARGYTFDTEAEDYLVHITTGSHVAQICLFLLTESRHFPAKLVQTGPPDRDRSGAGTFQIIDLDLSRYDRIATRFQREAEEARSFLKSGIDTRNPTFNALMERIERVALATTAPILLAGATGTGKSQLARRIYELKVTRRLVRGPLVEVNCATLRGDAAMSALFGHRKGAFTGSVADRAGLLKSAHGGVLFLDEIGELGSDEQAMLLRALEEKRFLPVGADREEESDFQLIAGTNRDLNEDVRHRRFREDLLARLDLWTFHLPGLAERRDDIEPNLRYELDRFEATTGRRASFNREAGERFMRFATSAEAPWPANFRDLNAAVTRMATLAHGGRITVREVDEEIERLRRSWTPRAEPGSERVVELLGDKAEALDRFDRVQLEDVLRVCRETPSVSEAGRVLFAESRRRRHSTNDADRLRKYLARFGSTGVRSRRGVALAANAARRRGTAASSPLLALLALRPYLLPSPRRAKLLRVFPPCSVTAVPVVELSASGAVSGGRDRHP
jgi:transcriptional regulatory protein RtcR